MVIDKDLIFEEDMAMPNATEADAATVRDLGAPGIAGSGSLWAIAVVTTKPTAGTSIQTKFQFSPDDSAWTEAFTGPAVAIADAVVGKVLGCFAIPPDVYQYIKGSLVGAGDVSTGKASLFMAHEPLKSL